MKMRALIPSLLVLLSAVAVAQPGSGSGSGSTAGSASGSGSGSGSAAGSASAAGSGSGSAWTPDAHTGATPVATGSAAAPADDYPMPAGVKPTKVCLDEMAKDPGFADYIIHKAEQQLHDKVDTAQVCKDAYTLEDHQKAQDTIATNERHVILAYIAMWLVAVGFVIYMWRRQQALRRELENLRRDLHDATKDGK